MTSAATPLPGWCLPKRLVTSWEMARASESFTPVEVPCTVAAALRARGQWQLGDKADFDRETWIFRTTVEIAGGGGEDGGVNPGGGGEVLVFDGLTPECEVRVDGVVVAKADNMFVPLTVPLKPGKHTIELHCLPLDLTKKKPRARWRSKIFDDPQRRWIRATAIGHTPTFGPSFATVGPWRPVRIGRALLKSLDVSVRIDGKRGVVRIRGEQLGNGPVEAALGPVGSTSSAPGPASSAATASRASATGSQFDLTVAIDNAELWWPHTHGTPHLYPLTLTVGDETFTTHVGFRHIMLEGDMTVRVNGQAVFCRGASWTPVDAISFAADPAPEIARLAAAGFNMVRAPANTLYESDAFYRACNAAGILVWHDFMFASLDFPFADTAFADNARTEAVTFLTRVQADPCIAVLCANSEVRMQAHMMGVTPPDEPFYDALLPKLCVSLRPDVPFVPGSPSSGPSGTSARARAPSNEQSAQVGSTGSATPVPSALAGGDGPLGFEPRSGCSHYYGVGAYQRPLSDARLSGVRFASEALGFAQRPGIESKAAWHDVPWEHRILRFDAGASDLADENEYYARTVFGIDPLTLRTSDRPLYDALLDIVPGVVMEDTYATWRSYADHPDACRGALVWLLRDMWRSTGLGIIDADGRAKPAFHYLRRAFAPRAVFLRDEGLNGVDVHLINERPEAHAAALTLQLYRDDRLLETFSRDLSVSAASHVTLTVTELMGRFADVSFAFRFGPRPYDLIVARWGDNFPAFFFPGGAPVPRTCDIGLTAERDGEHVEIGSRAHAHTVIIENAAEASDNYFHMAPGETRRVRVGAGAVRVSALNSLDAVRVGAL